MANHLLTCRPTGINVCDIPVRLKRDDDRRKSTVSSSSTSWFAPLFGVSSGPCCIDSDNETELKKNKTSRIGIGGGSKIGEGKVSSGSLHGRYGEATTYGDFQYIVVFQLASDFKDHSAPP